MIADIDVTLMFLVGPCGEADFTIAGSDYMCIVANADMRSVNSYVPWLHKMETIAQRGQLWSKKTTAVEIFEPTINVLDIVGAMIANQEWATFNRPLSKFYQR